MIHSSVISCMYGQSQESHKTGVKEDCGADAIINESFELYAEGCGMYVCVCVVSRFIDIFVLFVFPASFLLSLQ